MNFLKGLALSLLSFLLFLSLTAFGLAFMLHSTLLTPDFVVAQVDKLDISSLAETVTTDGTPQEGLSGALNIALIDTITASEPLVKEQVSAAIYPVYNYLLGKSPNLDLARTLKDTILNPDFAASLIDELDMSLLMGGFISEQITERLPVEELPEGISAALDDAVNETVIELEPWMKEQATMATDPVFDYLLGESQGFKVVIPMDDTIPSLIRSVKYNI